MATLHGKNILIGVTGGIAAYKSAYLIRLLIKAGAKVKVVMTPSASAFISPLTLGTLAKNPVIQEFAKENGEWNNHVELGLWADLMVIAPATANTISKLANGICDNFLLATCLSLRSKLIIAPAMDVDMYRHPAVKSNLNKLKSFGYQLLDVGTGELASGLFGEGRMAEPEQIIAEIEKYFESSLALEGKKVLVTAGPTYEAIDPVRFIGNHSSGKMGYAIAEAFAKRGAEVTLISGPVNVKLSNDKNIELIHIKTAEELYEKSVAAFKDADIAVCSAAVADYKPAKMEDQKIKKKGDTLILELVKTRDTLSELGSIKRSNQVLIGFALETNNENEHALKKLNSKNLDLIVLNSLNDKGAGFQHDTNKVSFIAKDNKITSFELKSKAEVAEDLVNAVINILP